MSEPTKAVFLSYAREDTAAAQRIADALRGGGVEVWFDQDELVGGDVWDAKIRKQIKECALFVPIVTANTQARTEGYFRLEWLLAAERTRLMGRTKAFLLPVCIDATKESEADVPESFLSVQWTRLVGGETPAAFVARVRKLLGGSELEAGRLVGSIALAKEARPAQRDELPSADGFGVPRGVASPGKTVSRGLARLGGTHPGHRRCGAVVVVALRPEAKTPPEPAARRSAPPTTENASLAAQPPPDLAAKSVAVLAFENLSGDKDNEYFSDGITEELINVLGKVPGLNVAGRTSSFFFKGKQESPAEIARTLGVNYLVSGSV